jgi:DNA-directed RNA polymerase specialized sigma subunit
MFRARLLLHRDAIGERNRQIRHAYGTHGYTLKEIAQELGVHYMTISKVINSEKTDISRPLIVLFSFHTPRILQATVLQ